MKRIIEINGMSCGHCSAKAKAALEAISGVKADVQLSKSRAVVTADSSITDGQLQSAVENAGYRAGAVTVKKGLFG